LVKDNKINLQFIGREKLSASVAIQIFDLIEKGSLKLGDKVPTEKKLVKGLGVSRTVVREGMQRLEMLGVVKIQPGKGTFVCKNKKFTNLILKLLSLDDILKKETLLEVLEVRKILELGIVGIVVEKGTEDDFNKLNECLKQHRIDLKRNIYPSRGDAVFHFTLAKSTHSEIIIELFNGIYDLVKGCLLFFGYSKKHSIAGLEFHERIYKSIVNRKSQQAIEAMREHLEYLIDFVIKGK